MKALTTLDDRNHATRRPQRRSELLAVLGDSRPDHAAAAALLDQGKRGDGYLRRQLMHGARALVRVSKGREGKLWSWINGLLARRPFNVVVATVANKLARILWALLRRGEAYWVAA